MLGYLLQHRAWCIWVLIMLWVLFNYCSSGSHGRPVRTSDNYSEPAAFATTLNRRIVDLNLGQYKQDELNKAFRLALAAGGDVAHSRGIRYDEPTTEFAALLAQVGRGRSMKGTP